MNKYTKTTASGKNGKEAAMAPGANKSSAGNYNINKSSMDTLTAIIVDSDGTAGTTFRKNYTYLKNLLITAKRERTGRWNINFIEAHEQAYDIARLLPVGVTLASDDGPDDPEPEDEPGWRKTFAIAALILLTELVIYLLAGLL